MANTALKKITTRARQIRKAHPSMQWKNAIKKAGAEYRSGSKKTGGVKKKKVYQTGSSVKRNDSLRKAKKPGVRRSATGRKYTERRKNRSDLPGKLTGVSAATLKSELKGRLKESLGKQLVRRELATTKRDKKKIQKTVLATKLQLRRLS